MPLQALGAVVGQHLHRIHRRLPQRVLALGRKVLQPQQQARQRGCAPTGQAFVLVLRRQLKQAVQIGKAHAGAVGVALPLDRAARQAAALDHQRHRLTRRQQRRLFAQVQQRGDDRVGRTAGRCPLQPGRLIATAGQPGQAVRQPQLGLLAVGQRDHFRRGQGVARIVEPAQASIGQHHLGLAEQSGLPGCAGDGALSQRPGDVHHRLVGPRQHSDVRPADVAGLPILAVDHLRTFSHQSRHAGGQRLMDLGLVAARQGPVGQRNRALGLRALCAQHHVLACNAFEGIAEQLIDEVHQRWPGPP